MERHCTTAFFTVAALVLLIMPIQAYACTVGAAHGSVTVDGRPIMWKMRDTSDAPQQLIHSAGSPYDYIGVRSEGGSVFMGMSEAGIGSGNATVTGGSNSSVQLYILRNYDTMAQIREYLNGTGAGGNFPFIDANENASVFEVDHDNPTLEYDTMDPDRAAQGLLGLVVRANEFHNHPDGTDDLSITGGRYESGTYNIKGLADACELSVQTITQGNSEPNQGFEYARYGPGRDLYMICRSTNRSFIAVHGVLGNEDPALATMWFISGNANYGIAVPTWVMVSNIPSPLATGDMYNRALSLYNAGNEMTTQTSVFPVEAHMFDVVLNTLLPHWRSIGAPPAEDANRVEHQMANDAYSLLDCLDNVQYDNMAPEVAFSISPDDLTLNFTLDANDSDGTIQYIDWNFGDGYTATQNYTPSHTYTVEGTYLISCTVTDDDGVSITAWSYFTVPVDCDILGEDGVVNFIDYAEFTNCLFDTNCSEPNWCGWADFNHSTNVDYADLRIFANQWLNGF